MYKRTLRFRDVPICEKTFRKVKKKLQIKGWGKHIEDKRVVLSKGKFKIEIVKNSDHFLIFGTSYDRVKKIEREIKKLEMEVLVR